MYIVQREEKTRSLFSLLLDPAYQYLRGKVEDLDKTNKRESHAESEYLQHDEKQDIFFFSLLLDLANQYLRGKEEDLDKTDKGESHAEARFLQQDKKRYNCFLFTSFGSCQSVIAIQRRRSPQD